MAIEEELAKPILERKSVFIRARNPKALKGELATYKTQVKPHWKGQFWMMVHDSTIRNSKDHPVYGTCIEIAFAVDSRRPITYEIIRPDDDAVEIFTQDAGHITPSSFTLTEVSELDDTTAAQYILMESPERMKLRIEYLSDETQEWLQDMNQEPSPLMRMIQKRGYFAEQKMGYLWIYKNAAQTL